MLKTTRRGFLLAAACSAGAPLLRRRRGASAPTPSPKFAKPTDIRLTEVSHEFQDYLYRAPYMFGGRMVDRVTLLNVTCVVHTRGGRVAKGFGSMPLGNVWSFPSRVLSYDETLGAMKLLAERIRGVTADYREYGHPLDLNHELEPAYLRAAVEVARQLNLPEPIPKLCTLVTASPFDAAVHDAFGKVHGLSCYKTYGPDFVSHDLARYLGPDFRGEFLSRYVLRRPVPRVAMYHSVGALDPIVASDVKTPLNDGLPETLPAWINYNGLTHIKIKLNGSDARRDIERVIRIDRATAETQRRRGVRRWKYLLDFNENCRDVGYLLDVLRAIRRGSPAGFARIQYIEQPTARDLRANRSNVMHEAAKLRPVVIDESLTDLESLLLAREMGYTGVALKACKGQSQAMLMAAAAQKYGMFLCVQDLTCPGAALVHSVGIAAHVPGVAALEANARQYVPAANAGWEKKFPGIFDVRDGVMRTSALDRPGLGALDA